VAATVGRPAQVQASERDSPNEDDRSGGAQARVQLYIDWHTNQVHGWGDPQPLANFASKPELEGRYCSMRPGRRIGPW
jgi:hypothetical protein